MTRPHTLRDGWLRADDEHGERPVSVETVAANIGPTIQHHLHGPLRPQG